MGVSYETDPQNPLQWFRERLADVARRLDAVEGTLRVGTGRGGPVTGTPLIVTPHTANGQQALTRRSGAVYLNFRVNLGAAVAVDGIVLTVPAGFRPPATGPEYLIAGFRYNGTSWVSQAYYLKPDGTLRLLQNGASSGDICSALVPPFLAG